jgi:hypothetical protein
VSWLPDDLWSRGKCGLKVLQYQAAGLPVVANPVGCQNEMIRPGANGFLASEPAEWVEAVRRLAHDHELRRRMGLAARRGVETDYSIAAWSETFINSMTGGGRHAVAVSVTTRRVDRPAPSVGRSGLDPRATYARSTPSLKPVGPK